MKNRSAASLFLCLYAILAGGPLFAQPRGLEVVAKDLLDGSLAIGKQYAVFIAIDSYTEWLPLQNPVRDARGIRDILVARYFIDEYFEVYNADATKANILRLFDKLNTTLKPEDSVIIYYAGHGVLDSSDTGFWIPVDAGVDIFEQKNWMPNIQIRNSIGRLKARQVALISDSCFSGDLINATRGSAPTIDNAYFKNAWSRVTRQVMTSGALETVPDASEFSRNLKSTLQGNESPYLDLFMIFSQVRLGVTRTTPLIGNLRESGHQDGGSYILFLKNPKGTSGTAQASRSVAASIVARTAGDLFISTSVSGADITVDGVPKGKSPLMISELPAGKPVRVTARVDGLGASAELVVQAGTVNELSLKLERLTGNLMIVSAETELQVMIDGVPAGPLGTGFIRNVEVGRHTLELSGPGLFFRDYFSIEAEKTARIDAKPLVFGSLALEYPDGMAVSIVSGSGLTEPAARGTRERLPVGAYSIHWSLGAYRSNTNIVIQRALAASLTIQSPSSIEVVALPANAIAVSVEGRRIETAGKTSIRIEEVTPGADVSLSILTGGGSVQYVVHTVPGKLATLAPGVGRLSIAWLPQGATVELDGQPLQVKQTLLDKSTIVLARGYTVSISLPGVGTYTEQIQVAPETITTVKGHLDFARSAITSAKDKTAAKIQNKTWLIKASWVALGAGAVGLVSSGVTYFMGQVAYDAYASSTNPEDTLASRKQLEFYNALFYGSVSMGGTGLVAAPVLRLFGSGRTDLDSMIDSFDASLKELQQAEMSTTYSLDAP